jgi:hypothetical protein
MERMIRALEPPSLAEGFAAIFRDDQANLSSILEHLKLSTVKEPMCRLLIEGQRDEQR